MLKQADIYNCYVKPFRIVEQLDLKCGYEKSFKMMDRYLLRNRYLLGIEKSRLDHQKLVSICEQMQMPEKFVDQFFDNVADANLVLLGFEEGIESCTYKIYLEYWDKIRTQMSVKQSSAEPVALFQGFKWNAMDNSRAVLTDYIYYPLLKVDEIIERIGRLGLPGEDTSVFDMAREIISRAARLAGNQPFIYVEASEGDNPRNSFDINLYPAGMTLQSIRSSVAQLFRHYAISNGEFDLLYSRLGSRPLGHLSGGIDRNRKDFFTVYYENQPEK